MNQEKITTRVFIELLVANRRKAHMNSNTLNRALKWSIVQAGLRGVLTQQETEDAISYLGYRSI